MLKLTKVSYNLGDFRAFTRKKNCHLPSCKCYDSILDSYWFKCAHLGVSQNTNHFPTKPIAQIRYSIYVSGVFYFSVVFFKSFMIR